MVGAEVSQWNQYSQQPREPGQALGRSLGSRVWVRVNVNVNVDDVSVRVNVHVHVHVSVSVNDVSVSVSVRCPIRHPPAKVR